MRIFNTHFVATLLCTLIFLSGSPLGFSATVCPSSPSNPQLALQCHRTEDLSREKYFATQAVRGVRAIRDSVFEYSKKYQLDPRVLAGVLMAERTLRNGTDDQEDHVARAQANPRFFEKVSFGPAQIQLQTAKSVEALAARMENRAPRNDQEILKALLDPIQSTAYAAAILRTNIDVYQNKFDIKDRIDIQATLYNLGTPEKFLAKTISENRKPLPSIYGQFVFNNLATIESVLGLRAFGIPSTDRCVSCESNIPETAWVSFEKILTRFKQQLDKIARHIKE